MGRAVLLVPAVAAVPAALRVSLVGRGLGQHISEHLPKALRVEATGAARVLAWLGHRSIVHH